jgi:Fe-S oxidoreductase
LNMYYIPPAHYYHAIRDGKPDEEISFNCLLCGRCQEICPVKINANDIRIQRRNLYASDNSGYSYLINGKSKEADVIYFAGCMTHLTPSVKNAMLSIMKTAGVRYHFMDEDGGSCCGRPLMMAGNHQSAKILIDHNKSIIEKCQAKMLVTSCPICLKAFREEYNLSIETLHHSQFIQLLIDKGKIKPERTGLQVTYHDPCELGRGLGIYQEPREVIRNVAGLIDVEQQEHNSLCCGGSLGNTQISHYQKDELSAETIRILTKDSPDKIITSCPLCKKTLGKGMENEVMDIAELVVKGLTQKNRKGNLKEEVDVLKRT